MIKMAPGEFYISVVAVILPLFLPLFVCILVAGFKLYLYKPVYFCSCVQIRNWFDYRNHICIVSIRLICDDFPNFPHSIGGLKHIGEFK